jgi:hypothetical protein
MESGAFVKTIWRKLSREAPSFFKLERHLGAPKKVIPEVISRIEELTDVKPDDLEECHVRGRLFPCTGRLAMARRDRARNCMDQVQIPAQSCDIMS